ncbi:MAG: hypothetical protein C0402_11805 [Thermodesulfovibrio sp.]|nr:hypothetical protein [Thermodesulfovibrio sp.]
MNSESPDNVTNRAGFRGTKEIAFFTLDLMPDPFIVLNCDGTIYDLNQSCADFIGIRKADVLNKSFADIESLNIFCEKVPEVFTKAAADFDLVIFHNRHIEVSLLPFSTGDGTKLLRIVLKDISNYVTLEQELLKRNKELIIINTLSSAFISSDNLDHVVENLLHKVLLVTDFSTGWLMVRDGNFFLFKTGKNLTPAFIAAAEQGGLQKLCSDIILSSEPLYIAEAVEIAKDSTLTDEGISFLAAVPLVFNQEVTGMLFLALKTDTAYAFNFDFAALLSLVGNQISMILDKIRLFQETRRLSITDGLTGLFNSRYFYKQLEAEIARSNRYGHSFSLIMFDIDSFKKLNDTYGHQAGDDVLVELARILQSASREADIAVRYGGEEFVIVLPNTSEADTVYLADRIRDSVEQTAFLQDLTGGITITLSGGVASYPMNAGDIKSLLNAADTALYAAKTSGKNRVVCFKGHIRV